MRWDCDNCGTLQIADTIENCPVCHEPRPRVDVAEEPASAPAPEGVTGDQPSGTFPADGAPPSPQEDEPAQPPEEEDDEPHGQD
jgi:hypothetical protein